MMHLSTLNIVSFKGKAKRCYRYQEMVSLSLSLMNFQTQFLTKQWRHVSADERRQACLVSHQTLSYCFIVISRFHHTVISQASSFSDFHKLIFGPSSQASCLTSPIYLFTLIPITNCEPDLTREKSLT